MESAIIATAGAFGRCDLAKHVPEGVGDQIRGTASKGEEECNPAAYERGHDTETASGGAVTRVGTTPLTRRLMRRRRRRERRCARVVLLRDVATSQLDLLTQSVQTADGLGTSAAAAMLPQCLQPVLRWATADAPRKTSLQRAVSRSSIQPEPPFCRDIVTMTR